MFQRSQKSLRHRLVYSERVRLSAHRPARRDARCRGVGRHDRLRG